MSTSSLEIENNIRVPQYINQCKMKMRTFQLQRLHNKSQNSKWKHQYSLHPKRITPTKMTSNLFMNNERIKSEENSITSKKERQGRRKFPFQVFFRKQATYSYSTFNCLPCLRYFLSETNFNFSVFKILEEKFYTDILFSFFIFPYYWNIIMVLKPNYKLITYHTTIYIANCISPWYTHVKYRKPRCFLIHKPV